MTRVQWVVAAVLLAACVGCTKHEVDIKADTRHEIVVSQPIHIKLDINVKIQKDLDNFFDFEGGSKATPDSGEKVAPSDKTE